MSEKKRSFIPNQVFVGLPWKNVRPKYERIIQVLVKKYPVHFTIVGRNDGQDAADLFEVIKLRISSSSFAIFDATGGNANVSLEYGYAEGIEVPRAIFLSAHKAAQKQSSGSPIISDLGGKRRIHYKTEKGLRAELERLCKEHDYTKRFERALVAAMKGLTPGAKKSARTLSLKVIHALAEKSTIRRAELIQNLQAQGYKNTEVESIIKKLHAQSILKCTVGQPSKVSLA